MTFDGYKSCRKLREKVLSTELNIRYRNTKYSSLFLTAPVADWLAYFPSDSYIAGSSRFGRNFIFPKISWLKGQRNVPAIQSTEWWDCTRNGICCQVELEGHVKHGSPSNTADCGVVGLPRGEDKGQRPTDTCVWKSRSGLSPQSFYRENVTS